MLNWIKFLVFTSTFLTFSASLSAQWINEIHYDNDGVDEGEGVEISGIAGTDLSCYSIELYNGNGDESYGTVTLSGIIPDEGCGYGAIWFSIPNLQNGSPDGVALIDCSDNVIMFLSYEGSFTAIGGPADGLTSTDIGVSEGGSSTVGHSLQLTGSGTNYSDFTWQDPSAASTGSLNPGQSISPCGSSNTISTDAISFLTFNVDCETDDTGTVDFSSVGTFNTGNTFTVQLSDEFGSFASPSSIGTLSGAAAEGDNLTETINIIIPAGTTQGSAYRVRVVSSDPGTIGTDNGSDITINYTVCPSQLPASEGLLINEFSNGEDGNKEYYEFIVAGRCGETVDVRGYIIDDNNGTFTNYTVSPDARESGIAAGHLRLKNVPQWSNIPVGSLIVVYNSADKNSSLPDDDPYDEYDQDGNTNPDYLYVMPQNQSDLLEITTDLPVGGSASVTHDSTYSPVTYSTTATAWKPLSIANDQDAVQVRMPDGTYFHGVSYGGSIMTGGPNDMKVYNGNMSGMNGWFNSGDVFDATNWSVGDVADNETPGRPNNDANEDWLRLMRDPLTSVCPVTPLPISLVNFYSEKETGGINLIWETETEQYNSHFNLYHSVDGFRFRKIGKVAGSGNSSSSIIYEFLHTHPSNGVSYYKLESVDFDGTVHQKGIISAIYEASYVYYNYSTSRLVFDSKSDYEIYSPEGRLIDRVENASSHPFHGEGIFFIINTKNGEKHKVYLRN